MLQSVLVWIGRFNYFSMFAVPTVLYKWSHFETIFRFVKDGQVLNVVFPYSKVIFGSQFPSFLLAILRKIKTDNPNPKRCTHHFSLSDNYQLANAFSKALHSHMVDASELR